jgi:hypothetical protein
MFMILILGWKEKIDGNYLSSYPDPHASRSVTDLGIQSQLGARPQRYPGCGADYRDRASIDGPYLNPRNRKNPAN